jgi:hypothetical protein
MSLNIYSYEDALRAVYESGDKVYRWRFPTRKEAERWRFRALGYIRALRNHVKEFPDDYVGYSDTLKTMNRMEHLVRQTGEMEWTCIIQPRAAAPTPEVSDVRLDMLDDTGKLIAINARDTREVLAERGDVRVQPTTVETELEGVFDFTTKKKKEA